jgi:hypothetical protein
MGYIITYAGHLESTMAARGTPARTTGYRSLYCAVLDIAISRGERHMWHEYVSVQGGDRELYVYKDQLSADSDGDGSRAVAVVKKLRK